MRNKTFSIGLKALVAAIACTAAFQASADIVISGTRIIYPQSAKDVIISLENRGQRPLLVQTWLDDGRDTTNPQELKLPFVITPPVSRVDPHKGQSIRITYLGQPLPQDKESLFWFNALEIPPKAKLKEGESPNQLQLAFRTRIKLFFRPNGLKGTPGQAVKDVKWSLQKQGSAYALVAQNNSPWNVSISAVTFKVGAKEYSVSSKSILPFASSEMSVTGLNSQASGTVKYMSINDNGGVEENNASI
ncbi:fimbrial chaperone [Salmonella enterica]|uniref:Fimbrial chaperone n=1 Tax=Salmonella enterica I TaxID=59201 RepID=A0A3Z7IDF5_SALET|nr:fimbrial chaperone [Salmonella enterica]AZT34371.1 fimbrial chaperone [Salmonella enterica subsp. enterica serovar Stanleyville]EAA6144034.1 fimbrial chaperone [Salmonella enterica subsp. enterica serovar Eboko]EAB9004887.1 fimbrial chaperone [Salmonella enterica subsp. enterica serovar Ajiobo]EAC1005495.1 fimbrial chaperone [Salmonella enterica subsp. enterica]ECY4209082.1 fimbrial chaperone [Salmonella enterica subsp. enterica serovar Typhimurium]EEE6306928.1 fimbrial chaperone [Salmonel